MRTPIRSPRAMTKKRKRPASSTSGFTPGPSAFNGPPLKGAPPSRTVTPLAGWKLDFHRLARSGGVPAFLEPGKADQGEPAVLGFQPLYSLLVPGPGGGDDIVNGGRRGEYHSGNQSQRVHTPLIIEGQVCRHPDSLPALASLCPHPPFTFASEWTLLHSVQPLEGA